MSIDWNAQLVDQLDWHWQHHLRPRLDGMTDEEYFFGQRSAAHFGGPPCTPDSFEYAGTADDALRQLDEAYATWVKGVRGLEQDGLARPCGPAEGPFAAYPLGSLVLHINREAIHHGAEICLLRDLYRNRG